MISVVDFCSHANVILFRHPFDCLKKIVCFYFRHVFIGEFPFFSLSLLLHWWLGQLAFWTGKQ